jgi:hypothetical protein
MTARRGAQSLMAAGLVLLGCAGEPESVDVAGECGDAYGGTICTWAQMSGADVVSVGATVPLASIEGAPADEHMHWPPRAATALDLPADAAPISGLMHLTTFWEPMGHPPGPYLTPHFDFHFYLISQEERNAIDCSESGKPVALPVGYGMIDVALPPDMVAMTGTSTLVGLCVPQMGMHSLLVTELESEDTFRGSMVIGYYQQKPIFIEPMISREMLMEKRSFTLPIPEIPGASGNYPREFRADFDDATQSYRFTFSAFAPAT